MADLPDPRPMIVYLDHAGCYLEFEPFFKNFFDRIRHEFRTGEILDAAYSFVTDVDELNEAAQAAIDDLCEQLLECRYGSKRWLRLDREIGFSKAVLARDHHHFGEANRFLWAYLIEIADDPTAESRIQVDFLRSTYEFPFVRDSEDETWFEFINSSLN